MTVTPGGRGPELMGVTGFLLAISTIGVLLRVYCRTFVVKSFGFDDWFAVIAWIFFVLFGTFVINGIFHGTGQHAVDIQPPSELPVGLKWWWACEVVYVLSNMALKLSIGAMLLRLTVVRAHRITIYVVLVITELYCVFFFFIFIFQCQAPSYFWTRFTGGTGSCLDPQIAVAATYGYSAIACAGDWTFAIIPCLMVKDLKMNPRTKIVVAMVLSVGAIASCATIVRIPYVQTLKNQADFLWATTDVAIWSCAETGLGISACSFATLRPLFRVFFSRNHLMGDTSSGKNTSSHWPSGVGAGYQRSRSRGTIGEFGLGLGTAERGVVTIIESDVEASREIGMKTFGSQKTLNGREEIWRKGSSESTQPFERPSGEMERELDWSTGIRKTTESKQVRT